MPKRTSIQGSEAVSLQEAKDQCYVTSSRFDVRLTSIITAVRGHAENETWRTLVDSTYELFLDTFPEGEIELPRPPITEVSTIHYTDTAGNQATMPRADYQVDSNNEYGRIRPVSSWPVAKDTYNAVTITYTAGYGADFPKLIRQAMLQTIAHWFNNTDAVVISEGRSVDVKEVPMGARMIFESYSARTFV